MKEYIIYLKKQFINLFKKETVFVVSVIIAVLTCFVNTPKLEYIDFKVVISLFNLIIVVSAFQQLKLLDKIAVAILKKCSNRRTVAYVLTAVTFAASMLLTNDVALITLVPLTIIIGKRSDINPLEIIVVQTLAANLGSSLTPIGNPQNLFIYSCFNVDTLEFLKAGALVAGIGIIALVVINFFMKKDKLRYNLEEIEIKDKKKLCLFIALFICIFLSVFRIIDYRIMLIITILVTLLADRSLFVKVDYYLLLTFVTFFIIVGNISSIEPIRHAAERLLSGDSASYLSSIIISQFISNVPAAVLLSGFTSSWRPIMLGVNVGGMGTLIASLASVIAYKLYVKSFNNSKAYLTKFHIYNFISLIIIGFVVYIFL
ncbi:SLC13 family permease [Clostridium thermarum]|uniref:SLC13 family permease n=1 Tax=Clostridium thermarum TaxID=1716543 RepID=UPI001121286A|nr:SLC13 family permease [Clostridium thermarum]